MMLRIDAACVLLRSVLEDRGIKHSQVRRARLDDDEMSCLGMKIDWFAGLVCSFFWEAFEKQGVSCERADREGRGRILEGR